MLVKAMSMGTKRRGTSAGFSTAMLVGSLVVAAAAIVWNLGVLYWLLVPGGSGEWTQLAVPLAWVIGTPLALAAVAMAFLTRQGSMRWKRAACIVSIFALAMPLLVTLFAHVRT